MTIPPTVPAPQKGWLLLVLLTIVTFAIFIVSVISLLSGWLTIFQNLFYIPIILACVYYTKRGFVFSVLLACSYFVLMAIFSNDPVVLQGAVIRVLIFTLVAGVITYLSMIRIKAEVSLQQNLDNLTESERSTRLSEERLIMAQEIGHTGCWEYTIETDKIWGSAEGLRIFGFSPVAGDFPLNDIEACIPERERVHQSLVDLISVGKKYNLEYGIIPADGSAPKIIYSIARLERDTQGNPIRVMGVFQDITGRKQAEDTLFKINQKLNILSQLTRKDLTNQLFVLSSYLELTKKQLAGQDRIIETVQKGVHAIQSIHEIIEYSKDYQDMGAKPPKWQNVKMEMLFGLSHLSIGKIQHSLETEDLEIFADPLLEKVCQRLFENSVKHGNHVTRIRVWHSVTPEGVTIVFEDDGIGIPQEKKEQIFLRGEGTRVSMRSLIFVREILDITGITIRENGEPEKGARFEMTVPKGAWRMTGNGA